MLSDESEPIARSLWHKWAIVSSVLVLLLFSILFYREWQLVRVQPVNSWYEDHRADCAVVLTGGPGRIHEGMALLAQQSVKKLIVSGVNPKSKWREIFPLWPYYGDLSEDDVILEKRSRTTYGNVVQTLPLVEALHCKDLVVVTSKLHVYRSQRIFSAIFPKELPISYRAVVWGFEDPGYYPTMVEVIKSLFYSLWAY